MSTAQALIPHLVAIHIISFLLILSFRTLIQALVRITRSSSRFWICFTLVSSLIFGTVVLWNCELYFRALSEDGDTSYAGLWQSVLLPARIAYAISLYVLTTLRLHRLTLLPTLPVPVSRDKVRQKAQLKLAKRNKKFNEQSSRLVSGTVSAPEGTHTATSGVSLWSSATRKSKRIRSARVRSRPSLSYRRKPAAGVTGCTSHRSASAVVNGTSQTSRTSLISSMEQSLHGHEEREVQEQLRYQRQQAAIERLRRRRSAKGLPSTYRRRGQPHLPARQPEIPPTFTWRFLTASLPLLSVVKYLLPALFVLDILLFYTHLVALPQSLCLIPFAVMTLANVAVNGMFAYMTRATHAFTRRRRVSDLVIGGQTVVTAAAFVSEVTQVWGLAWVVKVAAVVVDAAVWLNWNEEILERALHPRRRSVEHASRPGSRPVSYTGRVPHRHCTVKASVSAENSNSKAKSASRDSKGEQSQSHSHSRSRSRSESRGRSHGQGQSKSFHHVPSKSALSSLSSLSLFSRTSTRSSRGVQEPDDMIVSAPGRVEGMPRRSRARTHDPCSHAFPPHHSHHHHHHNHHHQVRNSHHLRVPSVPAGARLAAPPTRSDPGTINRDMHAIDVVARDASEMQRYTTSETAQLARSSVRDLTKPIPAITRTEAPVPTPRKSTPTQASRLDRPNRHYGYPRKHGSPPEDVSSGSRRRKLWHGNQTSSNPNPSIATSSSGSGSGMKRVAKRSSFNLRLPLRPHQIKTRPSDAKIRHAIASSRSQQKHPQPPPRPIHPLYGIPATEAEPIYSPTPTPAPIPKITQQRPERADLSSDDMPSPISASSSGPKLADVSVYIPMPLPLGGSSDVTSAGSSSGGKQRSPVARSRSPLTALPVFKRVPVDKINLPDERV